MIATKATGSNLAAMAFIVFSATNIDVAAAACLPDENDVKMLVQPSVKYVEITIINESVCDVMISPNVRLFQELHIL